MRATILASLVAVAAAAPAIVYETVDVYTTVFEDDWAPAATPPAAPAIPDHGGWHNWGKPHWSPPAAPAPEAPAAPAAEAPAATTPDSWSAPAAETPAAQAPGYSGSGEATPTDYAAAVIAHHNAHRANHSAPDLVWDDSLAATAQKIGQSCVYAHDVTTDGGGYGQNIAAGCPASNISSVITELFYNNEVGNFGNMYGQATPANINDESAFDGWGHFTQVVWKGTTSVGCATVDCSGQGLANTGGNVPPYFTVCNYKSPGNFLGEFASQVSPSLGYPSISWAST